MLQLADGELHQPEALELGLYIAGISGKIKDGEDVVVLADLPVEVDEQKLYFCRMSGWPHNDEIKNLRHLSGGLGNHMPNGVVQLNGGENVTVPDGFWVIKNARITLNCAKHVDLSNAQFEPDADPWANTAFTE